MDAQNALEALRTPQEAVEDRPRTTPLANDHEASQRPRVRKTIVLWDTSDPPPTASAHCWAPRWATG